MFKIEKLIPSGSRTDFCILGSAWIVLRDEKAIGYFPDKADAELFVKAKEQSEWCKLHPPHVPVRDGILSCGHPASEMVYNQIDGGSGIDCQVCTDACEEWDKRNA